MASYLFLDFDGVLHPLGARPDQQFCRRELLASWLLLRPELRVVISSSWRLASGYPLKTLREFIHSDWKVQERVVGVTPALSLDEAAQRDHDLLPTPFERETEIRLWMARSAEPWARWAALDDQAWLFRPFCKELVLCEPMIGLTAERLASVDKLLAE